MSEIWVPASQLKVTVVDGKVKVWEEMEMYQRPIQADLGFMKPQPGPRDPGKTRR